MGIAHEHNIVQCGQHNIVQCNQNNIEYFNVVIACDSLYLSRTTESQHDQNDFLFPQCRKPEETLSNIMYIRVQIPRIVAFVFS